MTVYVDDMRAPVGQMIMCHMVADTTAELLAMVDEIGVARRWIQALGTRREHFDICMSKRALAVKHGAVEIDRRKLAEILRARSAKPTPPQPTDMTRPGDVIHDC
ncbi:DUF4031 domain-containing protein [Chachezhania sediminis]|uniref:DUF4031 domain-containing protein n=1 Tax=Chachezhania sediminis TaxID=2599291 RepID=UPI00131E9682|nr:DUF4031 domain-containing protein [Chachezhania sediminis]